ncbi:MAG: transglycosylase domain-containing protein [Candidatus Komeilibacteria bacterium]
MPIPQLKVRSPQTWKDNSEKPERRRKKKSAPSFRPPKNNKYTVKKIKVRPANRSKFSTFVHFVFKKSFTLGLIAGILGLFLTIGLFVYYSQDLPSPDKIIDRTIAQSTKIYDRTGEILLYEIAGDQKRTMVSLENLPAYAVQATISIEDKNFYEHGGISLWGILRGQIVPRLQGKRSQGGSTLTQQFVKNAILTNERSLARKIKEWILSYRLEKKFSKDEILTMYFNEIPYGSNAYGIEAASNYYFDKKAADLSLAEATILAALPQAPSYYSPYGSNYAELIGRQQYILDLMVEEQYITEEEATTAKDYPLDFKKRISDIKAPHFVLYIKEYLESKYGTQLVEQGGLNVITTLDIAAQEAAESAITEYAETNLEKYQASNASLVAIDVPTGQIVAMVGSKDYFDDTIDGQVNVSIQPRQPGSSFKPFVYLSGFTQGFTPDSILFDLDTVFKAEPESYAPKNYDLVEHGPVTIRQALAGSLNTPAVKMIYLAGVANVLDLADNFGYTTLGDRSRFGLSLVLGGGEVKLIEHVNAFAALAREGVWKPYQSILSVKDENGRLLEEYKDDVTEKVVDIEYVRMLNSILSDNEARSYIFGEANYLTLPGRPVAAKTGTTNDYRDAWTIGYTPYQVAAGVWVGNNDNSEMKRGAAGGVVAAPVWKNFLKNYLTDKEIKYFTSPNYTNSDKPMIGGFLEGGDKIKIDRFSKKLATNYTPDEAIEEKTFKQIHNILHYVERGNIIGSRPSDPTNDYQYANWEEPVIAWAAEQGMVPEQAPTEYDDLHQPGDKPYIHITNPSNNITITTGQINLTVNTGAPRGAAQVKYFLDDKLINTQYSQPFSFTYTIPPAIANGTHTIKAKVYDDILNNNQDTLVFNLDREEYITTNWVNPTSSTTIDASDFPFTFQISINNLAILSQVDFYYRLSDSNQSHWFGFIKKPSTQPINMLWQNKPSNGVYKVYPVYTDVYGQVVQGNSITISVE